MTPEERAEARLTAEMLGAARLTDLLSVGLTLLALAALVFRVGWIPGAVAASLLGLLGRYYGFRVALDRRLFDDLAEGRIALGDLDAALRSMTRGKAGVVERSVADRCRGARRLITLHAAVTVAQIVAVMLVSLIA